MITGNRYSIIVIEPSYIVVQGLKAALQNSNYQIVNHFDNIEDFCDWHTCLPEGKHPGIIILNPIVSGTCELNRTGNLFHDCSSSIVALIYSYISPEALSLFDDTIGIYDSPKEIVDRLKKLTSTKSKQGDNRNSDKHILTRREKEILIAIVKGLTNKEIADRLYISTHTVISHRKNIVQKTGIKTVPGLLMYALFNNIVTPEEIPQQ